MPYVEVFCFAKKQLSEVGGLNINVSSGEPNIFLNIPSSIPNTEKLSRELMKVCSNVLCALKKHV